MRTQERFPRGWEISTIEEVVEPFVEQQAPGAEFVPYIDIGSIDRLSKRIGDTQKVNKDSAPTRARQRVQTGDVLVSMTRPNLNAVALVSTALHGAVASTGFDVLRATGVLPEWLFARVQTMSFIEDMCKGIQGVVYPAIRPHDVRQHQIPIAPLPEQLRIVGAIDSYFTRLDEAVATLERVQRNLKRYRASVLKAAVEGRLVPTEAELARAEKRDYEPASELLKRILVERRRRWEEAELAKMKASGKTPKDDKWKAKYEEPAAPDASKLPELPEGWCWVTMSQLIVDGPQNGLYVPKTQYGTGTPIIRIDDYQFGWSRPSQELQCVNISSDDALKYGVQRWDLIINRVNSPSHLGKSLVITERHLPAVFESNMMRMELAKGLEIFYIHYYLSSVNGTKQLIRDAKWAVNQASINQTDVARTPVPLPPSAEQIRIVSEVERLFSAANAGADAAVVNTHRCQRLRQSVLKWAFEGKLVDQDPNDEPASVLLDRIRAERAAPQSNSSAKKPRRTSRNA